MSVGDVKKKLVDLSEEQLEEVRDYERQNKNRKTLVEHIERKLQ
jgi:hypothetical protein